MYPVHSLKSGIPMYCILDTHWTKNYMGKTAMSKNNTFSLQHAFFKLNSLKFYAKQMIKF